MVVLFSSRLASIGNGTESEEAFGNALGTEGGAWTGAGGGLELSDSSKSSGSSSMRIMIGVDDKVSKQSTRSRRSRL